MRAFLLGTFACPIPGGNASQRGAAGKAGAAWGLASWAPPAQRGERGGLGPAGASWGTGCGGLAAGPLGKRGAGELGLEWGWDGPRQPTSYHHLPGHFLPLGRPHQLPSQPSSRSRTGHSGSPSQWQGCSPGTHTHPGSGWGPPGGWGALTTSTSQEREPCGQSPAEQSRLGPRRTWSQGGGSSWLDPRSGVHPPHVLWGHRRLFFLF